jgi:hypothetical protein
MEHASFDNLDDAGVVVVVVVVTANRLMLVVYELASSDVMRTPCGGDVEVVYALRSMPETVMMTLKCSSSCLLLLPVGMAEISRQQSSSV